MMGIVDTLYLVALRFIRIWKWGELQLLKIFITPLNWIGKEICEMLLGIVLHFPEEDNGNQPDEIRLINKEKRVALKCRNYDTVVHLNVHSKKEFFIRILNKMNLGYGEGYMDGVWDFCNSEDDLVEVSYRFMEQKLFRLYQHPWNKFLEWLELYAFNLQSKRGGACMLTRYTEPDNDLFELMLDPWMQYSCGYWVRADNLNDAQLGKMELIAKKLQLKPGMRVLDLWCGWGMLSKYLAEKHGVHCVGVAVSQKQAQYAREKCYGLNVEIRVDDYRTLNDQFDRIVSVGMLEHVGYHNYREFFKIINANLKKDGIFLLQTVGLDNKHIPRTDLWLHHYIVPNGHLPRATDMTRFTDDLFVIEDWHNFGTDHVKTLRAWRDNFKAGWGRIEGKYGDRFYRMWILYLCKSEALFKFRAMQCWQVVLSKNGLR